MIVSYKNRKLLLPMNESYYYWVKKYNAKVKFLAVSIPVKESYHPNCLLICADCGTHAGVGRNYDDGTKCPACGNTYNRGNYLTEYNPCIMNTLIDYPRVRKGVVTFDLWEYAEDTKTTRWIPERYCTIRYAKETGLEVIPAPGKKLRPIHHLESTPMKLEDDHVQKLIAAFEKVHPGNGVREMLWDKRRVKLSLDIKVFIQYFYYLGKYPQLEQLVKSGYGAVVRDIMQLSPRIVNERIPRLFNSATREKNIVKLPSFVREFIKSDPDMNDKRMLALETLCTAVPNMSREDFEMFRKVFPRYLIVMRYIIRMLEGGEYSFREVCKLILGSKGSSGPKELLRYQTDYIRMCKQMEIPYERFPKDIRKLHDAVSANYQVKRDAVKAQAFQNKCDEYRNVTGSFGDYLIRFPNDMHDLIMEGSTMHHCVASYADRVIEGSSIIFFMRKTSAPDNPYITMEFNRKGELVQARKRCNASVGDRTESAYIRQFQKEILMPVLRSKKAA